MPSVDFYEGDVRNRELVANLLRRVDAVYHFAAYQDYFPEFSRFSAVNVVPTAMIYEIIVAERLELAWIVVASSQGAMGEGLYRCARRRRPDSPPCVPNARSPLGTGTCAARVCDGPLELMATPETSRQSAESVRNVEVRARRWWP